MIAWATAALACLSAGVAVALPAAAVSTSGGVVINEIESDDDKNPDWIELVNASTAAVDISGWIVKDDDDSRTDAIAAGTILAPGAFYVFTKPAMSFGLGKADAARLFRPDGQTLVDAYSWTAHAAVTYGRCPDGVGAFAQTTAATPGATNVCGTTSPSPSPTVTPTPSPSPTSELPPSGAVVVNEVESNGGDPDDWFELFNTTDAVIDLTGYEVRDDGDASDHRYELPSGSLVPAHGFLVVQKSVGSAPGFPFGLGSADKVRLFAPDRTTLVAEAAWTAHAATTLGRCPDGTGELRDTAAPTKGAANACGVPVAINEVESNGGSPDDWIELVNRSAAQISVGGLVVTDSEIAKNRYTIPAGTTIAAQGYLVLEKAAFGFGLGGADAVHLFAADGVTELDATSWTAHAATTWGRCPDATGPFAETVESTAGSVNACTGDAPAAEAWPGGASVRVLDAKNEYPDANLSGLDVADGGLWAVENGRGRLHRIVPQGDGWVQADGWVDGKALHYPNGSGRVDAEAVTAVGDAVYVGSERDNDDNKVSRPAVLRYEPSTSASELVASTEWNLAADFPGLGANAGIEGLTWISDAWLIAHGFVDATTGAAYVPARYPGHGDGLFFVGVEGTASVYAYALAAGGGFSRVATLAAPFSVVAEVQFSADRLWVVCDDACDGRIATFEITPPSAGAADGTFHQTHLYARPAQTANVANEGFAIGTCVDGIAATFYADDARTDGFSLRSGTIACTAGSPTPEPTPTPPASPTPESSATPRPSSTLAPTGGTAAAVPPSASLLTDATRGGVRAPASALPGQTVTITVATATPGQAVHVWMFSTPADLGAATVTAVGTVSVTVPSNIPAGVHRLVVTDAAGAVLGWTEITVAASALASTGADAGSLPAFVALALIAVLAGLGLRRRAGQARRAG
ncbi:lamin tail domain-containing protein [Microbacterium hominis]|nr:lamin tail domain-containing protein [Microbacterium hominis]